MELGPQIVRIHPEYVTDPPSIIELISGADLVSLHVARLRTLHSQLKSEMELIEQRLEVLEKARRNRK